MDNTICESRQKISDEMIKVLEMLKEKYTLIIVTARDYKEASIQCPISNILFMCQNGNEIVMNDKLIFMNPISENLKEEIYNHITLIVNYLGIKFDRKEMIEDRGAEISFSLLGHKTPMIEKKKFDLDRKIRNNLLQHIPFSNAFIGGTTCIDYVSASKGDNIKKFIERNEIKSSDCLYLGDSFDGLGNDATVCGVIPTYEVRNPQDTLKFIKQL